AEPPCEDGGREESPGGAAEDLAHTLLLGQAGEHERAVAQPGDLRDERRRGLGRREPGPQLRLVEERGRAGNQRRALLGARRRDARRDRLGRRPLRLAAEARADASGITLAPRPPPGA